MLVATTWTLDFNTTDIDKLENIVYVNNVLTSIIKFANFTVVSNNFKKFEPVGMTSVFLLEESHVSIHTWPEHNCFYIDIFTCKPLKNIDKIIEIVLDAFDNSRLISKLAIERKTSANKRFGRSVADGRNLGFKSLL